MEALAGRSALGIQNWRLEGTGLKGVPQVGAARGAWRERGRPRTTLWASLMSEGHQDSRGQRRALQFICKVLGVQLHIN